MTKQKRRNHSKAHNRKQMRDSVQKNGENAIWIWGIHAAQAVLNNPKRELKRVLATPNLVRRLDLKGAETMSARDIEKLLPPGAVHQGLAVCAGVLPTVDLDDLIREDVKSVAVLDQISDPQNLGAVWRSAAAFGIEAIIPVSYTHLTLPTIYSV